MNLWTLNPFFSDLSIWAHSVASTEVIQRELREQGRPCLPLGRFCEAAALTWEERPIPMVRVEAGATPQQICLL